MTDQYCLFYAGVAYDGLHRAREKILRICDFRFVALAVTRQIDQQAPVFFIDRGLHSPERKIASPTVDEDDGLFARSIALVMNAHAVERGVSRRRIRRDQSGGGKNDDA